MHTFPEEPENAVFFALSLGAHTGPLALVLFLPKRSESLVHFGYGLNHRSARFAYGVTKTYGAHLFNEQVRSTELQTSA